MYTKEELEKLPIPELMEIAAELDIKVSQDDELEHVIYAILDKAAENSAAGVATPKRKRTRITKDNSKVYTVNGTEAENLDVKATKKVKKPSLDTLFAEQEAAEQAVAETEKADIKEEAEKPAPKKRGRKSKKELEAIAVEETEKAQEVQPTEAAFDFKEEEVPAEPVDIIPEAAQTATESQVNEELLNQLQEKMVVLLKDV